MSTATKTTRTKRAKAPAVHVTLAMFDTRAPIYRVRRESVPIHGFAPLGPDDYVPSASSPRARSHRGRAAHMRGSGGPPRAAGRAPLERAASHPAAAQLAQADRRTDS